MSDDIFSTLSEGNEEGGVLTLEILEQARKMLEQHPPPIFTPAIHPSYRRWLRGGYMPWEDEYIPPVLVKRVIAKLEEWYQAMEDGTANDREPDFGVVIDYNKVDGLIELVNNLFIDEIILNARFWASAEENFHGMEITKVPDFSQIKGWARLAFYQDIKECFNDAQELRREAERKILANKQEVGE